MAAFHRAAATDRVERKVGGAGAAKGGAADQGLGGHGRLHQGKLHTHTLTHAQTKTLRGDIKDVFSTACTRNAAARVLIVLQHLHVIRCGSLFSGRNASERGSAGGREADEGGEKADGGGQGGARGDGDRGCAQGVRARGRAGGAAEHPRRPRQGPQSHQGHALTPPQPQRCKR
eukprot:2119167-Rhodomonas_salina.3